MFKFNPDDYMKRVFIPAAEAFAVDGSLPDVFARFDLPLDCDDKDEIEQAVRATTSYWIKQKNNIKYKRLVEVLLKASGPQGVTDLRTLQDPTARVEQRKVVEQQRQEQQQARFEKLNLSISGCSAKGYITPAEKKDLIARYVKEGFSEPEIVSLIHVPEREQRRKLPTAAAVNDTVNKAIRTNLATLNKKNLYEFLGINANASAAEIQRRYSELTNEWDRRLNNFDKSAAKDLLAIVKTHFFGGMQDYENLRVIAVIDRLRPEVRIMAADKRIAREEFDHLLGMATKQGLSKELATEYILSLAEECGASLEWAAGQETIACAACHTFCATSAEKCKTCGADLRTDCPKCKTRVVTSERACTKCGFVVGNLPKVKLLVRQAQLAIDDRDIAVALGYAREAEDLWGRSGDVALVLGQIEASRKIIEEIRQRADKAVAERRHYAARQILAELTQHAPRYTWPDNKTSQQITQEVEAQLARAERALQHAAKFERERRYDEAVFSFLDALSIAADADTARAGLKRLPPQPATNVRASLNNNQVLLQWFPSSAVGDFEYVVVRGESFAPTNTGDGRILIRTKSTSFTDPSPPAGKSAFYAVFVERGGAISAPASSPGIFVTLEVSDFRLEAGDGSVRGTWNFDLPEGRVRVFCLEDQSAQKTTGREVNVSGQSFRDGNLRNGVLYYYRARVEYRDAHGETVLTNGVVENIRPEQPPKPVDHVVITCEDGVINLSWTPPPHGSVTLYRNTLPSNWRSGAPIPLTSIGELGTRLRSKSENHATDSEPAGGTVYYTPVTVSGDVAIVGTARRFVAIPDVTNLVAEDFGRYLQLRWEWPKDCKSVMVAWRDDSFPEDHTDSRASKQKISLGQYERDGAFRLGDPAENTYRFVVFAALELGGETVYSSGIGKDARAELRKVRPASISYTLSRGRLRRKHFILTLSAERDIARMPELVVVAKAGGLQPLRTNDGDVVTSFSDASIRAGEKLTYEFDVNGLQRPTYFRAFFREAASYQRFRLIDPPSTQLLVR